MGSAVPHQVVIIGGGFGGLYAARALRDTRASVTLLDRRNFHLFQPLLYQVATGGLSPGDIAIPLRLVLKRQPNARVLLGEVTDIDVEGRRVIFAGGGGQAPYQSLIVAPGARHHYFGHDSWEPLAPGLKSVEDATAIRRRILMAFEAGELERDPAARAAWLTFVIVGGGPTGVELAGALSELARDTLRHEFRSLHPEQARILLVESLERVLPTYDPSLSRKTERFLLQLGVTVRTRTRVEDVRDGSLKLVSEGGEEEVRAHTVLWAAGVRASPLGAVLAAKAGATLDRAGRVVVGPDLTIPGHPEIFVVGDLASARDQEGRPVPAVATAAMQEGRYAASVILKRLSGEPVEPFRYVDKGSLATIGRSRAVAQIGRLRFAGLLAWLLWLLVHIAYLIGFQNRVLVLTQWAWNYITRGRRTRLITGEDLRGA